MSKKGIDVSKWQGLIDWKKVKTAGIEFAMIRLGYGSSRGDNSKTDAFFKTNIEGALAAGIDVGVYFYSYALNAAAAAKEAAYVVSVLAPYKDRLRYPVAYDIEDESQRNLGKAVLTAMVEAFCTAIESAGYYASFYANLDWCSNRLDMNTLKRFDLWLAQWASKASTKYAHGMWQYTSSGSVNGISGNVDMNTAIKDYPAIIGSAQPPVQPVEPPKETPKDNTPQAAAYTVKKGDTLSKIAADHGTTLAAVIAANPQITNPNLIHVGDVVNIPGAAKPAVKTYTVKKGDSLSKIATAHKVTLAAVIAANPQIANPNLIHVGDVVNIPA